MNILDENFPEGQRQLLRSWRISVQQIGLEIGRAGMEDETIIPLLHQLRRPTFLTLDFDFYKRNLCHRGYCIAYLNVVHYEAAKFARRFLRHSQFNTEAKRMGTVVRISHAGLTVWRLHAESAEELLWEG